MTIFSKKSDADNPADTPQDTPQDAPQNTPEFVTREDFEKSVSKLSEDIGEMSKALNRAMSLGGAQHPPAEPASKPKPREFAPIERVSEQELAKAIYDADEAKIAALLGKALRASEESGYQRAAQEVEAIKLNINAGVQSIADLTRVVARGDMPHYERYKTEIDALISQLPAEQRMNPETYKYAHGMVVSQHLEDIIKERLEAALRAPADEPSATPQPSGTTSRAATQTPADNGGVLPPEEVWDRENLDALKAIGKSPEDYVKSLGYKSWADYFTANKVDLLHIDEEEV